MFTGIIEEIGVIRSLEPLGGGWRLSVSCRRVLEGTRVGDSISVSGICLTVVGLTEAGFSVDVMPETYRRSSLSGKRPGERVNLERSLTLQSRLGGHLVSGHIDGTARLVSRRRDGNSLWMEFAPPPDLLRYIALKGSVALDGTSLTVAHLGESRFAVGLIPATQELTTLAELQVGQVANLEVDLLARYLERLLGNRAGPALDLDFLQRNGYA